MKRLIVLILIMTVLVACGSTKDADEADVEKEESDVGEAEVKEEAEDEKDEPKEKESEEAKEEPKKETKEESKEEPKGKTKEKSKEESKDKPVHKEEDKPKNDKQETDKKTEQEADKKSEEKPKEKPKEKPEKAPAAKNEKVEVAAENIIWAQNNRDYGVLKGYLGQNITLNEKNNRLKITNVDYPHDADLLKGIKAENMEHRFTQKEGKDHIVGFAVTDYETEMSYTIDLTMRVGKDSWKMLNMQINK